MPPGRAKRTSRSSRGLAIPGTTKLHRLEENLGASTLELTAQDLAAGAAKLEVKGARYREQFQKMVGR